MLLGQLKELLGGPGWHQTSNGRTATVGHDGELLFCWLISKRGGALVGLVCEKSVLATITRRNRPRLFDCKDCDISSLARVMSSVSWEHLQLHRPAVKQTFELADLPLDLREGLGRFDDNIHDQASSVCASVIRFE